ncbi:hypothetical protein LCGC14_2909400, partial [marine sediment metagenome]
WVELRNSRILESDATASRPSSGGGFAGVNGADALIINSTIDASLSRSSHSSYSALGGGIYWSGDELTVEQSTISNNQARHSYTARGGGIYRAAGAVTIIRSEIIGNVSDQHGGGIYGQSTIIDSIVANNQSVLESGGGIYSSGTSFIVNSTIADNVADDHGGGIYQAAGTLYLTQSTVSGNRAALGGDYAGGGIFVDGAGTAQIVQSTIVNNEAFEGGGVFNSGTTKLTNTIVAANTATSNVGHDVRGSFNAESQYNLIGIVNDSTGLGTDPNSPAGTLAEPLDSQLDPLADNGGSTPTLCWLEAPPSMPEATRWPSMPMAWICSISGRLRSVR